MEVLSVLEVLSVVLSVLSVVEVLSVLEVLCRLARRVSRSVDRTREQMGLIDPLVLPDRSLIQRLVACTQSSGVRMLGCTCWCHADCY